MASREYLTASGPEDLLRAVPVGVNTSAALTAGSDWAVGLDTTVPLSSLRYTDLKAMDHYNGIVTSESSAAGIAIRHAAADRLLCSKAAFSHKLCLQQRYEHQGKGCTPAELEYRKCAIKVARTVDLLCKPSFTAFTTCLESARLPTPSAAAASAVGLFKRFDVAKCFRERTAFDTCIEDF